VRVPISIVPRHRRLEVSSCRSVTYAGIGVETGFSLSVKPVTRKLADASLPER
jgi:hypothetical protein